MNKPKALIIDIDGTLANIEHRRHFVDGSLSHCCEVETIEITRDGSTLCHLICSQCNSICNTKKPDWKSFNEAMDKDTVNQWCAQIIQSFSISNPDMKFIFLTGREEKYRGITADLIWDNLELLTFQLLMRPDSDYRSDVEIKREIYEREIKDKYDVLFCIDDRNCVVDLWRSLGLVCLQCAPGDF